MTHKTGAIETKGLQTTAVFAPRDDQAMPSDTPDAQHLRRRTHIDDEGGAMDRIIARLGDACAAPFAVLGLRQSDSGKSLAFPDTLVSHSRARRGGR